MDKYADFGLLVNSVWKIILMIYRYCNSFELSSRFRSTICIELEMIEIIWSKGTLQTEKGPF